MHVDWWYMYSWRWRAGIAGSPKVFLLLSKGYWSAIAPAARAWRSMRSLNYKNRHELCKAYKKFTLVHRLQASLTYKKYTNFKEKLYHHQNFERSHNITNQNKESNLTIDWQKPTKLSRTKIGFCSNFYMNNLSPAYCNKNSLKQIIHTGFCQRPVRVDGEVSRTLRRKWHLIWQ